MEDRKRRENKEQRGLDSGASADAILESISDGVFTVGSDWRITSFNRAAEAITGIPRAEAIGRTCAEVFRSNMCESACALRRTIADARPIINQTGYIVRADGERVPISVSTAVLRDAAGQVIGGAETFRDLSEIEALRRELSGRFQIGDMVSRSEAMRHLAELVPVVAASTSTVLIQGETGTGKELLARALHAQSPRADKPFVALNCAALPDSLLESELFGYKKGAFTGANRDKPGRFALASHGTLFLDEIGEIGPAVQVKLLRVLQEQVYEPLGSVRPEKTDARIVLATNRNLADLVREGRFRQDLFYRINVIAMELPPLRERMDDLAVLVEHILARLANRHSRAAAGVTPEALALLAAHNWPGNVRELQNVIERAWVLCGSGLIGVEHLPLELRAAATGTAEAGAMVSLRRLTERQYILNALERNGFNKAATARELGIHKTTLFRKLKALGLNSAN